MKEQVNKKRYPLVNWTGGMNINRNHLIQLEDHFINQNCEYQNFGLTKVNYGLLPFKKGEPISGDFDISELVTGALEVRLNRCHAITSDGYLIDFNSDEEESLIASFNATEESSQENDQRWDVILTADPFSRRPSGIPDEKEKSPRHPNVLPKYVLNILPAGQINANELGRHHLVIGRLRKNGNRYEVDANFIPPCTSISSHPDLKSYYLKFGKFIDSIEKASKDIISKVENTERQSELANNIEMMCHNIILYIATIYFSYRNEGQYFSPLRFLNVFSVLAHICYVSLDFMNKSEKEELLKYFHEWSDVKPGEYDTILRLNAGLLYDHNDIRRLMVTVEQFLYLFNQLWTTLSSLEYIGKHKENIVVAERSKHQGETKESRWSLLD